MDIKKANVNLLLGKIRVFLDAQPAATKKGKKIVEAKKALFKLEKIFADKKGELNLLACTDRKRVIDDEQCKLLACTDRKRVIDGSVLTLRACPDKKRVIDGGEYKLKACTDKKRVIDE
jgi:hypothetical protein